MARECIEQVLVPWPTITALFLQRAKYNIQGDLFS